MNDLVQIANDYCIMVWNLFGNDTTKVVEFIATMIVFG